MRIVVVIKELLDAHDTDSDGMFTLRIGCLVTVGFYVLSCAMLIQRHP